MKTLIIIPTFNERPNLPSLANALLALDTAVEILVVDDNSPDGTGAVADALARQTGRLHTLHRPAKLGLGTAYVDGFRFALAHDFERVVQMDCDWSHQPEDLPRLLDAANFSDVVIGSRNVPGGRVIGWSWLRQAVSRGGSLFARTVLGLPIRDCTSGFKCFRRRALERLDLAALRSNGYAFQVEVDYACYRAGMRLAEVPIVFPNRVQGTSKMSWRIVMEAALVVLRLRLGLSTVPIMYRTDSPAELESEATLQTLPTDAAALAPPARRLG
jgi:dolichol-phosphate mannosyltransferase